MSRLRLNKVTTPTTPASSKGEIFYSSTLSPASLAWQDENSKILRIGGGWTGAATAAVTGPFASDTYMTGTSIDIGQVGGWKAGMVYEAAFDMTKTGAGVAAPVVIIRMGTAGTTGDAAILTLTGEAQTGAADTGLFLVQVTFRSIGSSTAAVIAGGFWITHNLSSTGLTSAAQVSTNSAASSGFDSTTSHIIGVSFNGGASFSGTNVWSRATLEV